ncbi:SDR family NAD(P)-dependent oxidoreductase [Tuwongella immobilis]|uniref:Uncharacterized protein n=1 Tax=Tuwongella immobilis TaxID=692036 RepID=A0A6C2YQK5_9BACT|nr:glucose 1-dehydrogenase [Tuwongella immobilis]VIP03285.1 short-chain dehydrogenase : Uncharacterized protein OS=Singulisphaera acidiphila (strain ATCC BAA-1392 / DSM 18658 / VKM B-2454 / MOB10) GN=Sinac_1111 PE=3 SV=1: adh_short_C2 [Tuwongella immobilis]VTS03942.1 short-chain dehydrogenase : Uncharacterized protein OS=Singulisphaera acidiphila (strain ATCC BAA-1392 / DSM 18658 / VKM B-2454 / MOB10) GN=Sinac_1111 PE=3 SV=1: adh_short_C2 [Tuwongella immobilis]
MDVFASFRLDGRRACITGGSRGLGRAMAQALAEAGADLVLIGREAESLQTAQSELSALGRRVDTIVGDLGQVDEAQRVGELLARDFGPLDILVNNVGGRRLNIPTEEMSLADWNSLIQLNLTSVYQMCQHVGRMMIQRGQGGSIINVASIAGIIVSKGIFGRHYETAKAAVMSLTRSLAVDWARYHIRVNAIAPGLFLTDPNRKWFREKPELQETFTSGIPMGRAGEPKEIGPLALYLASDASNYMTGATLVLDGGYTLW